MQDIPTIAEAGVPGDEFTSWFGMFAPAGTPPDVIEKINVEVVKIMATSEIRTAYPRWATRRSGSSPDAFTAKYLPDIAQYASVVKQAGDPPAD